MTRRSVAVVVCAYSLERWDDLRAALLSAVDQQPSPDEIWLVVDHNDILEARARRELAPVVPGLRVLGSTRKPGLSGARNTAIEHVESDVIAFLDDDATAEPGWVRALLAPYADPAVLAVGGVAKPSWPDGAHRPVTLPIAGLEDDWSARGELDWVVGCSYAGQPEQTAPVRNLMGCNMSFRRSLFPDLGGFSEDLGRVGTIPLGCEETELCIRARASHPDGVVVLEPRARVRHHVSRDRLTWAYLRRRCYAEGVSKAAVAALVGPTGALSTERGYVSRVLPAGVARQLRRAVRGRQPQQSLAGAVAIGWALAVTTTGYLRGRSQVGRLSTTPPRLGAPAVPLVARGS